MRPMAQEELGARIKSELRLVHRQRRPLVPRHGSNASGRAARRKRLALVTGGVAVSALMALAVGGWFAVSSSGSGQEADGVAADCAATLDPRVDPQVQRA